MNFAFPFKTTRTHNNHQQRSNSHFHISSCFITCVDMFLDSTIIKIFYQLQQFIAIFCIDEIDINLVRGFIIFHDFINSIAKLKYCVFHVYPIFDFLVFIQDIERHTSNGLGMHTLLLVGSLG